MDSVAPWMDALHEERRLQVNEQQTSFHNEHRTVDAFADGPGVALLGLIFVLFAVFAAVFALCAYFNVGDRINLMWRGDAAPRRPWTSARNGYD